MNNSVKVTANESGQVVNLSSNPEYGYIRVTQTRTVFEGGWMRKKNLSAIISGPTADLKAAGFVNGQSLPGNIIVSEQTTPFNAENPEKDLKIAGDTGVICTVGGEPIYRKTFYTEEAGASDITLAHDNQDEIQARRAELEAEAEASSEEAHLG